MFSTELGAVILGLNLKKIANLNKNSKLRKTLKTYLRRLTPVLQPPAFLLPLFEVAVVFFEVELELELNLEI